MLKLIKVIGIKWGCAVSSELDVSFQLFSCVVRQRDPDSGTFFHQIFTVVKETYLPNWGWLCYHRLPA